MCEISDNGWFALSTIAMWFAFAVIYWPRS
jgi:hypothetical protein